MIRNKSGIAFAFLLAAVAAPWSGRAETTEAEAKYAVTDPATGKTGTAHAMATAVISENMVIEFVTPMNLKFSAKTGKPAALRLVVAGKADQLLGDRRNTLQRKPTVAVQGLPNQTFAVSIDQVGRGASGSDSPVVATFTHSAGDTPHIGPRGDTEFMIGATLRLTRNAVRRGYNGTLDLIVSHN